MYYILKSQIKKEKLYEFLAQNNLHIFVIFVIFTYLANIWTLNAYKKNCDYVVLLFLKYQSNNIFGALYYIFKIVYPKNKILLTFIEIKAKSIWNWKCP